MYLATMSPNPAAFSSAGALASILVSAMITAGCSAFHDTLKLFSIIGAVSEAKPSIEGAVAKMQNIFLSSNEATRQMSLREPVPTEMMPSTSAASAMTSRTCSTRAYFIFSYISLLIENPAAVRESESPSASATAIVLQSATSRTFLGNPASVSTLPARRVAPLDISTTLV